MKQYQNDHVKMVPYVDDMPSLLNHTDLIVSRAGASTIAEITAIGVPAILIPSPYVAANHQEYNALELVQQDAAKMILEKDLNAQAFVSLIDEVMGNQVTLDSLKQNAKKIGKPQACHDMYRVIKELLNE